MVIGYYKKKSFFCYFLVYIVNFEFQAHHYTGHDTRKCKLLICVFSEVQDTTKVLLQYNILFIY